MTQSIDPRPVKEHHILRFRSSKDNTQKSYSPLSFEANSTALEVCLSESFVAKACMTEALNCALIDCKIPSLSSRCWTASTTSVDAVMRESSTELSPGRKGVVL